MTRFFRNLALAFASGALGGLISSIALWFLVKGGVAAAIGVKLGAAFAPEWLYPRIVWGGLWGFLFVLPILRHSLFWRGVLWSLIPTLFHLFYVFPYVTGQGMMGLELGYLTPLLILSVNLVWGLTTAFWLFLSGFLPDKSKEEHRWFSQKR